MVSIVRLLVLTIALPAYAQQDFSSWLDSLQSEAAAKGIRAVTLDAAQPYLTIDKRVHQLQSKQPEFTQTLSTYMSKRVSEQRVLTARRMLKENEALLDTIAATYGVTPRAIVALWGMESDFGRYMGSFSVLTSLTTLAYSSRRADYFRRELMAALKAVDQGHARPEDMLGSWAGAMGQCQFMPWNYGRYAVDFNADGKRDIWHTKADALASIAHFLQALGWDDSLTWGRQVQLLTGFDPALADGKTNRSLAEWHTLGVRRLNGDPLPQRAINARLLTPKRSGGKTFLVYANFDVFMKWNRSHYFAIAAGTLSDQLRR